MTRLLMLLTLPSEIRAEFHDGVRTAFPSLAIDLVNDVDGIDPYLAEAEVLITFGPHLRDKADDVLGRMPKLKWVQALGTGVDNIADRPSLRRDVILTSMHGLHGAPVSEAALAAMLALARNQKLLTRNQEARIWDRFAPRMLNNKTVGIFGIGVIAEALAPRCKALGMTVVGISSSPRTVPGFDRMVTRAGMASAVKDFDFFVVLTPLSADTRGIVDAKVFAAMKPGSFFINLARGGVVDEVALEAALKDGPIAAAALDVFIDEPLPTDHPFWAMENVFLSPHVGGLNESYATDALPILVENIRRYLAGDAVNLINRVAR
jgi:phosphoglycerate dehydrogenase-like enzyme